MNQIKIEISRAAYFIDRMNSNVSSLSNFSRAIAFKKGPDIGTLRGCPTALNSSKASPTCLEHSLYNRVVRNRKSIEVVAALLVEPGARTGQTGAHHIPCTLGIERSFECGQPKSEATVYGPIHQIKSNFARDISGSGKRGYKSLKFISKRDSKW